MPEKYDVKIIDCELYFLPLVMRIPLKFGSEVSTGYDTARVRLTVEGMDGRRASGWGESPLSPAWAWPSASSFAERLDKMRRLCRKLGALWKYFGGAGHPMEIGYAFLETQLPHELPELAELTCNAPFDLALHDAYGNLHGIPVYDTYNRNYMNRDLMSYFGEERFRSLYPEDFFSAPAATLPVWHLVGGRDPLCRNETGRSDPRDGYPVLLDDWITEDGLKCLKVKLRGNDPEWDYERLLRTGRAAAEAAASAGLTSGDRAPGVPAAPLRRVPGRPRVPPRSAFRGLRPVPVYSVRHTYTVKEKES